MHEMSLALEICRITEEHVGRHGLPRVTEVAVGVGSDAGVELANLQFCLEALLGHPPFSGARPRLIRQPGTDLQVRYVDLDEEVP